MPELPEVETTRRGIAPYVQGRIVKQLVVRQPKLRWLIPPQLSSLIKNRKILSVERRAKYLLLRLDNGSIIIHLGMSGNLRICPLNTAVQKHDHMDILFADCLLRFTDPRRFGAILWLGQHPEQSTLLSKLGPEPLSDEFTSEHLYIAAKGRKLPVKQFIMDQSVVTGVGNIYATEALFQAGINPTRGAGNISQKRYQVLVEAIKESLQEAIKQGGTTLKDFVGGDGKPGYFQQTLHVYGKAGEKCEACETQLKTVKLAGRTTVYCPQCQK